jgi:hypothetical protein
MASSLGEYQINVCVFIINTFVTQVSYRCPVFSCHAKLSATPFLNVLTETKLKMIIYQAEFDPCSGLLYQHRLRYKLVDTVLPHFIPGIGGIIESPGKVIMSVYGNRPGTTWHIHRSGDRDQHNSIVVPDTDVQIQWCS